MSEGQLTYQIGSLFSVNMMHIALVESKDVCYLIYQEGFPNGEAGWRSGGNCALRDQAACAGSLAAALLASELL